MLAIQFIASAVLRSQGADAEWHTHSPLAGVDYSDPASVAEAVALLELDADGAYQYRITEAAPEEAA